MQTHKIRKRMGDVTHMKISFRIPINFTNHINNNMITRNIFAEILSRQYKGINNVQISNSSAIKILILFLGR